MTSEQRFDRLEQLALLLCERPWHDLGKSRKQTARLGDYVTALREYDVAKLAVAAKPDDSETNEALYRAEEILKHAREELKR